MTLALLVTLKVAVGVVIFAIGLGPPSQDVTYLWRRPALMARSLARDVHRRARRSPSPW